MLRRNIWGVALRALFLTLGVGVAGWGALVFPVFWQQSLVVRSADRVADFFASFKHFDHLNEIGDFPHSIRHASSHCSGEISATSFDKIRLSRFSQIMGLQFDGARMALTDADPKRTVPVFSAQGTTCSGYHAGGG